jgi:hypothetical protein
MKKKTMKEIKYVRKEKNSKSPLSC